MSRYALDKVLWEIGQSPDAEAAFKADPTAFIADRRLTEAERSALTSKNLRALWAAHAHPFLIYTFALRTGPGWSLPYMKVYVEMMKGLEFIDIET